jgi:hypothetical protein
MSSGKMQKLEINKMKTYLPYYRFIVVLAMIGLLGSCSTLKIKVEAPSLPAPVNPKVPATVGVYYSPEFKTYVDTQENVGVEISNVIIIVELGPSSVALFDQVFKSLFEKTVTLENKPTHGEQISGVDAIIEPSIEHFQLFWGNHAGMFIANIGATIGYRVQLFSPMEGNIGSWYLEVKRKNRGEHMTYGTLIQKAMREAAAKLFISFHEDPAVKTWLKGLNGHTENPKGGNK